MVRLGRAPLGARGLKFCGAIAVVGVHRVALRLERVD